MDQSAREKGRAARDLGSSLILTGALLSMATVTIVAREPNSPETAIKAAEPGPETAPSSVRKPKQNEINKDKDAADRGSDSPVSTTLTEVQYDGTPTPGARITIGLDGPLDADTTCRWVQCEGPPVTIEDPTKPELRLTIPPDARKLGFLLTLTDRQGQRNVRVNIPVRQPDDRAPSPMIRANAGDDQIGLVGRRITLNGSSSPRQERVSYRWIQLGGPRVDQAVQEKHYYSFIPSLAGIYRLGLVVAATGTGPEPEISAVDEVIVTVGEVPPAAVIAPSSTGSNSSAAAPLEHALQAAGNLAGKASLEQVAGVFDALAERASLYSNFAEMTSEMTRRLDSIVPQEPGIRQLWVQGIFTPLSQHIVMEMFAVGLDLRYPQAQQQDLNAVQKDKLHKLLVTYSREFRSRSQAQ